MWECKRCREENEDAFDSCWSCGTNQDGTRTADSKEFESLKEDIVKSNTSAEYATKYGTARMIAQFVSFVGWLVVVISVLILFISITEGFRGSLALMRLFPSLAGVVSGLLLVMAGQMTRATVDTADNTGHMLAIIKKEH